MRLATAAALAAGLLLASRVAALDGDAVGMTLDGRAFSGNPRVVVAQADLAYVGLDTGVEVWDLSSFTLVGSLYLPSPAHDIALQGSRAFVACGESGLVKLDVSDPANLQVMGSAPAGDARGVASNGTGSVVVVADAALPPGGLGLLVFDGTGPADPAPRGALALANGAHDVALTGSLALVALGADASLPSGLATVDVSTPTAPVQRGFLDTGLPAHGVDVDSSLRAYVATGLPLVGALVVADVSSPASPSQLSRASLGDAALGVDHDLADAWVSASSLGVVRFDVSNPAAPARVDALPLADDVVSTSIGNDGATVTRSSTGQSALVTFVAQPATPVTVLARADAYAEALGVALADGVAYVARRSRLAALDTSVSPPLELAAFAPPDADFSDVAASSGVAAVAQGECVRLVDVSNPPSFVELGQACVAVGAVAGLALDGPLLYVATGRSLDVFDVSLPSAPVLLTSFDAGAPVHDRIAVDGARGLLAGGPCVAPLDLSAPDAPVVQDALVTCLGEPTWGVAVAGDLGIVTGETNAAIVLDLAAVPYTDIARIPGGPAYGAAVAGTRLFLAEAEDGVSVHDLLVPAVPVFVASYDTSSTAVGVATDGAVAHVVTRDSQYWSILCDACASACALVARVDGPASACQGERAVLDASASSATTCAGALDFQWYEDGLALAGETAATLVIPASTGPGFHLYEVDATCSADPSCADVGSLRVEILAESAPTLDPASLRVVKQPATADFRTSWVVTSGTGDVNVHRDLDPARVSASAIDGTTVLATVPTATPSYVDADLPGANACFYIVAYPVGACSGGSVVP